VASCLQAPLRARAGRCTCLRAADQARHERRRRSPMIRVASAASTATACMPGYRAATANVVNRARSGRIGSNPGSVGPARLARTTRSCVFRNAIARSVNHAFRYFSAHCWARKQITSHSGAGAVRSKSATLRSPSALSIHSSVSCFIQDHAPAYYVMKKAVALGNRRRYLLRCPNDNVQREWMVNRCCNVSGYPYWPLRRLQYNQQISVAVLSRRGV
jgi:hypothetical protein